jgi:tetrahydromethanopterin:alpha-L-glutamate ligase
VVLFRIGIVTAQFARDETCWDLLEAARKKAIAEVVDPIDFSALINGNTGPGCFLNQTRSYDAMIIRGLNFTGNPDFQFEIFEQLAREGTLVINKPSAIQIAESKYVTAQILKENNCPVPVSLIVQKPDKVLEFLDEFEDIIVKPIYGFKGIGVIRVNRQDRDALAKIIDAINEFRCVCLQQYIENPNRDIRAFVVGDKVVSSIYRFPEAGEWKTNIGAGGTPQACILTPAQAEIALRASHCVGLDYTGVDIIEGSDRDYVLEVNGAPGWGGIMAATGFDVAGEIISHVIERLESRES